MSRKSNLGLFVLCLFSALPAFAQLDSAALRVKFGEPLHRETFHMPQGFDLTVDYGAGNQVCRLEVPAQMPPQPNVSGPFNPEQQMQDFLADLLPGSIRGAELRRFAASTGPYNFASWIEYEHVNISESNHGGRSESISVTFKNAACR
jgi:hypothetical protein